MSLNDVIELRCFIVLPSWLWQRKTWNTSRYPKYVDSRTTKEFLQCNWYFSYTYVAMKKPTCFLCDFEPISVRSSLTCSCDNIAIFIPTKTKFADNKQSKTSTNATLFLSLRPYTTWCVNTTQLTCSKELIKLFAVSVEWVKPIGKDLKNIKNTLLGNTYDDHNSSSMNYC